MPELNHDSESASDSKNSFCNLSKKQTPKTGINPSQTGCGRGERTTNTPDGSKGTSAPANGHPTISQRDLSAYIELLRREKSVRAARSALRDQIIARVRGGEKVEPGPLTCELCTSERRTLGKRAVVKAVGVEMYQLLIGKVEPVIQVSLQIHGAVANTASDAVLDAEPVSQTVRRRRPRNSPPEYKL